MILITCRGNWYKLRIVSISLVFAAIISLIGCNSPIYVPAPSPSAPEPDLEPSSPAPEPSTPGASPPITVSFDYFGIRDTHWMPQVGGGPRATVQLIFVVSDEKGTLAVWPPPSMQNLATFDMDFFQVESLKDYTDPVIFQGSVSGTLAIYTAAYNLSKGQITKDQIDFISKMLGFPDLSKLKDAIPDRELVGYYWHTWSAPDFGVGERYDEQGGNLAVWFRIGAEQMPEPVEKPVLKPNVKIEGELPTNVRVRTPYEYRASDFVLTLTNNESFEFPIYWRLETTSNPGTEINYVISPTEGQDSVPANGAITVTNKYWFTTPGDYKWKYIAECPKGNQVDSWVGTLRVSK
jgi:hypothetical protein